MLGCFNPIFNQIWTNPNVGLDLDLDLSLLILRDDSQKEIENSSSSFSKKREGKIPAAVLARKEKENSE